MTEAAKITVLYRTIDSVCAIAAGRNLTGLSALWAEWVLGDGFPVTELSDLPPLLRAERYRALAADARRGAALTKGALHASYILIAEQWERLAAELTNELNSGSDS